MNGYTRTEYGVGERRLVPASSLGRTMTGTFSYGDRVYTEPLVDAATDEVFWPGSPEWSAATGGGRR